MLKEIYNDYLLYANMIDNWKEMSITELANKYLLDKENQDLYFCALMVRYWYLIPVLYNKNKYLKLQLEDYVGVLADGILLGFQYCGWADKTQEAVYGHAEKVFNRTIYTVILRMYKYINQDKRRINYENFALDSLEDFDYLLENNCQNQYKEEQNLNNIVHVVNSLLDEHRFLEAVIIDQICWGDTYKLENGRYVFKKNALIKSIRNIDTNYKQYFSNKYNITVDDFTNQYSNVIDCSNSTFVNKINTAYQIIKRDKEIKECF